MNGQKDGGLAARRLACAGIVAFSLFGWAVSWFMPPVNTFYFIGGCGFLAAAVYGAYRFWTVADRQ